MKLIYSKKVSKEFIDKLLDICQRLEINPNYLMACMAFETGETFSPSEKNKAGSGATGLIQFMPKTARGLGTTTEALAKMDAVKQLDYVERYFRPYRGRLKTLEDTYMAILLPSAIGKPNDHVLFSSGRAYRQNSGLDINSDGKITKAECASKVRAKLERGQNFADFHIKDPDINLHVHLDIPKRTEPYTEIID